jgi:hypothetical protein
VSSASSSDSSSSAEIAAVAAAAAAESAEEDAALMAALMEYGDAHAAGEDAVPGVEEEANASTGARAAATAPPPPPRMPIAHSEAAPRLDTDGAEAEGEEEDAEGEEREGAEQAGGERGSDGPLATLLSPLATFRTALAGTSSPAAGVEAFAVAVAPHGEVPPHAAAGVEAASAPASLPAPLLAELRAFVRDAVAPTQRLVVPGVIFHITRLAASSRDAPIEGGVSGTPATTALRVAAVGGARRGRAQPRERLPPVERRRRACVLGVLEAPRAIRVRPPRRVQVPV